MEHEIIQFIEKIQDHLDHRRAIMNSEMDTFDAELFKLKTALLARVNAMLEHQDKKNG